jgi:hypothetical protein
MAHYDLSKILQRELWTTEDINESPELLNFYNSGILTRDTRIKKMVNANDMGTRLEIPFLKIGDYIEPNISDDSTNLADVNDFEKIRQFALLGNYNQVWGSYDIARMLDSGNDPFIVIRDYIARYWSYDIKHRMASMAIGILENNKDKNDSDLHLDKSGENYSYEMIIDTHALKGDRGMSGSDFMIMHSKALASIKKEDSGRIRAVLNESNGKLMYHLYDENSIIIVDDIMPFDGENTTVLFADMGSVIFEESDNVTNPLMFERDELIGDGGGKEIVITRKRYLLSYNGFSYLGVNQEKSTGATLTELQDKDNYERIVDKKLSPISFLTFAV